MQLLDFTMPPVTRNQWATKELKDEWEPRANEARRVYQILEKFSVVRGLRRCATVTVHSSNMEGFRKFLGENGLFFVPIEKIAEGNGFTHNIEKPRPQDTRYSWFGVIAKVMVDAYAFLEAYTNKDDAKQGELLGYPKCCVDAFVDNWSKGYFDPIWQFAANSTENIKKREDTFIRITTGSDHLISPFLRYIGIRAIPHMPCTCHCEESSKIAEQWIALARDLKVPGVSDLEYLLSMPVEWDCLKGIAYISSPMFKIEVNSMTCYPKYVVQKEGTEVPINAPRGLKFPWNEFGRPSRRKKADVQPAEPAQ